MTQIIKAPDGTVYEFPDDTPDDEIVRAIEGDMQRAATPKPQPYRPDARMQNLAGALGARGTPSENPDGSWTYNGRAFANADALNAYMKEELLAAHTLRNSRSVGPLTSAAREATFGWSPDLAEALGGPPASLTRQISDLHAGMHPVSDTAARVAGGLAGFSAAAAVAPAVPVVGPAVSAANAALGRIPAMTQAGRAAAAAGRQSLGATVARTAAVTAPAMASHRAAEEGVTGENLASGALEGAASGAVGGGLIKGAADVIRPWASQAAQSLIRQGVRLSPGQTLGSAPQRIEEGLARVEFVGGFPRSSLQQAEASLNTVAGNRVLRPLGAHLAPGTQPGHAMVEAIENTINNAYDDILRRIRIDTQPFGDFAVRNMPSSSWRTSTTQLGQALQQRGAPPDVLSRFNSIVTEIEAQLANGLRPYRGHVVIPGEAFKVVESNLRNLAQTYQRSPNPTDNMLSRAIYDLRGTLRNYAEQHATSSAAVRQLRNVNAAYAHYNILRDAAQRAANRGGVFSADQLLQAVRAADPTKNKRATATGRALMQDLAGPASQVMRASFDPRVSTFESRAGMLGALTGMGYLGASPAAIAAGAAIPLMHNPASRALIRAGGAASPAARGLMAHILEETAPALITTTQR